MERRERVGLSRLHPMAEETEDRHGVGRVGAYLSAELLDRLQNPVEKVSREAAVRRRWKGDGPHVFEPGQTPPGREDGAFTDLSLVSLVSPLVSSMTEAPSMPFSLAANAWPLFAALCTLKPFGLTPP